MATETIIRVRPIEGFVLIDIYDRGMRIMSNRATGSNIILPSDDMIDDMRRHQVDSKHPGIRPRWGRILAVSQEAKEAGLHVGDDILADTLKWSRGVNYARVKGQTRKFWRLAVEDVLLHSSDGRDEYIAEVRADMAQAEFVWEHLDG